MKFKLIGLTLLATLALNANATPTWNRLHQQHGLSTQGHAFCFQTPSGELLGANSHLKVRLASVSKLITTLWAIDRLGPRFQYQTHFYYKDGTLHIQGSQDTVFSRRKLFYLVNQLNHHGITQVERLSFDDKTLVFAGAEDYVGHVLQVTPERTAQNLKDFLHTPGWQNLLPVYRDFYRETPSSLRDKLDIRELSELSLSIGDVQLTDTPPFNLEDEGVLSFPLLSSALEDYMKFMNIVSNNFIADQTFENLGGEAGFDEYIRPFLEEHFPDYQRERTGFQSGEATLKMYTGSGLNTTRNSARVDNYATCAVMLKLIEKLDQKSEELETRLQELVAVPGSDRGTFRVRLNSPVLKNSIMAKTGSLYHTSALAGLVQTPAGRVPFGVFHQIQGSKALPKLIQDQMVRTLIDQYGGPAPFAYQTKFFFPATNEILD